LSEVLSKRANVSRTKCNIKLNKVSSKMKQNTTQHSSLFAILNVRNDEKTFSRTERTNWNCERGVF